MEDVTCVQQLRCLQSSEISANRVITTFAECVFKSRRDVTIVLPTYAETVNSSAKTVKELRCARDVLGRVHAKGLSSLRGFIEFTERREEKKNKQ